MHTIIIPRKHLPLRVLLFLGDRFLFADFFFRGEPEPRLRSTRLARGEDRGIALCSGGKGYCATFGGAYDPGVVYRIRRAQVLWCLTNKPQERLAEEQLAREAAAARGEEVVVVAPPKKRKPVQVTERPQEALTNPLRKRKPPETYQPEANRPLRRGRDRRALTYEFVREMAKTPTDMMGLAALRAERDTLLQTAFPVRLRSSTERGGGSARE